MTMAEELQTVYDVNAELVIALENIKAIIEFVGESGVDDAHGHATRALAYAKEHTPT